MENTPEVQYTTLELRLFGNEQTNSVSLRELYLDLGYDNANFSVWAKRNLEVKFEENMDYVRLFLEKESNQGGKSKIDYIITLDIAKHIAMSSDKPKGFEIRKYFIEVEKIARKELQLTPLQLMEKANKMLLEEVEEKRKLLERNKKMMEGLKLIEESSHDTGSVFDIEELCKIISDVVEGSNLGRTKAYTVFKSMDFVMKGKGKTTPTQEAITRKYLNYQAHTYGYKTVVYKAKANKLIKLMVNHLTKNEMLNEALDFPFHPELR